MSDELVREYLNKDEPTSRGMLLVNPFTRLSGWPALGVGLIIVLATAAVAVFGRVHYDGIMDVHVGRIVPAGIFAAEAFLDWLVVAVLFWIAGAAFGAGARRVVDYFAMSAIGRLPFVLVGLCWMDSALGRFLKSLENIQATQILSYLQQTGALPWVIGGGLLTMLIMLWGLFLNFFALREASGMKTGKAVGVYAGVIVAGEVISKLIALAVLFVPGMLGDVSRLTK